MAQCKYCEKYIPEGIVQCPHCHASLHASTPGKTATISPFEIRAQALLERRRAPAKGAAGRLPASRMAVFGCLGLIVLVVVVAGVGYLVAPDKARQLIEGTPTSPPPTRRPTLTPSPVPSPTPTWPSHTGTRDSFALDFPEYWIVVDYDDPNWDLRVDHKTHWYSWLAREFPEGARQQEAEMLGLRAFDPRRLGFFSIRARLAPDLAGMTVNELQSYVGQQLQRQGRSNVRAYDVELDNRPGARFEFNAQPHTETPNNQEFTVHLFVLADENQGYWIEIQDLEADFTLDQRVINAIVNSFRVVSPSGRQND
jgi:hypothetical protein